MRGGQTDQAQEPGSGDEQWKRSVPASFAISVGMPSIEEHREERHNVRHSTEQADLPNLKSRLILETSRQPENHTVSNKVLKEDCDGEQEHSARTECLTDVCRLPTQRFFLFQLLRDPLPLFGS